ncbi:MAG TPA: serine/threonine-protein kinase, partial [Gemmataceae bacterium]|nr:serine/threonine-protein kinase [Gemmataceae bacterium]
MSLDPRVLELLQRWEEECERGHPVTPEELCRDCPEHLDAVRRGVRALGAVAPLLDVATVADPQPPTPPRAGADGPLPEGLFAGTRYRLLRFHRKGGQGEVFVAHDAELNREVALKRIQDRLGDNPDALRRFLLEAEITGRLQHPGVVPVHGRGKDGAAGPYYVMRFVEGQSLQDAVKDFHAADRQPGRDPGERSLAFRELLTQFIAVCNVIAYAHSRGVIHRDVKPANVMLGKYGETLVVDWGLAKAVGRTEAQRVDGEDTLTPGSGGDGLTRQGSVAGTPMFASPEQARGAWDQVGPASDVYSLGATLFVLLTGEPPFTGRDAEEVLDKVRQGELAPPRQFKREVPAALEAVCLKAMALRPDDRYATPRELAEEVERWLADEPVGAWPEPVTIKVGRWLRRRKPLVAGAAAALLVALLAAGAGLFWYQHDQARRAAERAEQAHAAAQQR